jgi:hypothetical protein
MQADAYAGYDRLYVAGCSPGLIVAAARRAHARRKFFDLARLNKAPIAIEAVARIDALSAIERDINGLLPEERRKVRQERSRPRVEALGVCYGSSMRGSRRTIRSPRRSPTASMPGTRWSASSTKDACA